MCKCNKKQETRQTVMYIYYYNIIYPQKETGAPLGTPVLRLCELNISDAYLRP